MNNLCERSCDICNLRMYCQGCSLCEMPFCKFDCKQCFSLCPRRGFSWHYLAQVGGGQVTLQGNMSRQLPALIPVLPDHMPEAIDVGQVVGIHGGNFFSENGERVAPVYRRHTGHTESVAASEGCIAILCQRSNLGRYLG